ncbi:oxidoreductase [Denitrobaculum tricleocarpae]|uniref:Oxidoreductase n=1 Tax=Denitrobaculum tricleocarpae TaxID=2591009 RepID=A0A545TTN8_9PROT|nr:oxidoreductase [Denitrobaculum tricleocarpae]TQV80582.1 oxidoreductase [Denitrobaculum tricleocarpae]
MTVRVGLIGYGLAGRVFHAPLFPKAGLELAAVASSRPDDVKKDHPDARIYATPKELCADENVDLIVVAAPSDLHVPLMLKALAAGKHVVSDKPFTPSVAEADNVIAAAKKANRIVSCFQNRRWDSDFLTMRKLMGEGALGDVHSYRAHFEFFRPEVSDIWQDQPGKATGLHYDLGSHLIDQALVLFGTPDWLSADITSQRPGGKVVDGFHIRMAKGRQRIDLMASVLSADFSTRYAVHGTQGSYMKKHMDIQEEQLRGGMTPEDPGYGVEPQDRWAEVTVLEKGKLFARREPSVPGAHYEYYRLLGEAIERGGRPPVLAEEARETIRMIEAAKRSSEEGRRIEFS